MPKPTNPWKTLSSKIVHQTDALTLYEDSVIKPNGQPGTYTYFESRPFVLIVGFDGTHFIMIRQYRYPLKRVMTEFAGGSIEPNEDPLEAAKREFWEETGFTAKQWAKLGTTLNPNQATIFLAQELTSSGHNEMLADGIEKYVHLTPAELDAEIAGGDFDCKMLAALLLFERHQATRQ